MGWAGPKGWRGWDAQRGGMHQERARGRELDRDMYRGRNRTPERGIERGPAPGGDSDAVPRTERRPAASGWVWLTST